DCGAIHDIHQYHKITSSLEESAALAVKNGCDLNCGKVYGSLLLAVKKGLIEEEVIDLAVSRLMRARMLLGMFDPPEQVPYAQIPYSVNDCKEHRRLALEVAQKSMVLLKNDESILPLKKDLKNIAVIGPNAHDTSVLLGNYNGTPSRSVTFLEGIRSAVDPETNVMYAKGCDWLINEEDEWGVKATKGFSEACAVAERADVVILCLGITAEIEGEEGAASRSSFAGDRDNIDLPEIQQQLLEAVVKKGKPIVIILSSGSPVSSNYAHEHASAILQAWYPGEEGGTAVAEVVFGDYNPAGRLPVTFVKSLDQLPPFSDYCMEGRTYRHLKEEPLYPFGYGLSYTKFRYSNLILDKHRVVSGESVQVSIQIENTGSRVGDEVVQLYLEALGSLIPVPRWELQGFSRIHLQPGEKKKVKFLLGTRKMALIDSDGLCVLEPGDFRIHVGGRQPDERSAKLTKSEICSADFELLGPREKIPY
ncbi:MAG: glycoside hydrolase family 3 C-terminal domain-containing protein, partial [Spirochaetales bacterium]|nr:glycoside hydrolase family 3 C-terminal domain-containing protein [Spirochaetales bacterium]